MLVRVSEREELMYRLGDIPVYRQILDGVNGLPDEEEGIKYIVSARVRDFLPERTDLLSPSGYIRDEAGNVVGCTGFISNFMDTLF